MSSIRKFLMRRYQLTGPALPDHILELEGVGSHDSLGGPSSNTVASPKTPKETNNQPCTSTHASFQSAPEVVKTTPNADTTDIKAIELIDLSSDDDASNTQPCNSTHDACQAAPEVMKTAPTGGTSDINTVELRELSRGDDASKTQPCNSTHDACQAAPEVMKTTTTGDTSDMKAIELVELSSDDEDEDDEKDIDVNSKIPVELLESDWSARMEEHHRTADSYIDNRLKIFNCACGYNCIRRDLLEKHEIREIFGRVFQCPHKNCDDSYGQFYLFRRHCREHHGIQIWNMDGCYMCGVQFKIETVPLWHKRKCPGRSVLEAAMTARESTSSSHSAGSD